jgi:hypothetical protein
LGETPVTLPGNNITGMDIVDLIDNTNLSRFNWSIAEEPPTKMADAPRFSTFLATLAISS